MESLPQGHQTHRAAKRAGEAQRERTEVEAPTSRGKRSQPREQDGQARETSGAAELGLALSLLSRCGQGMEAAG